MADIQHRRRRDLHRRASTALARAYFNLGVMQAQAEKPDLILMDMSLPVMDGCQATMQMRAQPELAAVPIIGCTAHNQWEWRSKAILAGCTDFMTKPLNSAGLVAMLSRYL